MPPESPTETDRIDFRVYIGMLVFRWQIILLCFLYCLLGGVLYLHFASKEYVTLCRLLRYQEGDIRVARPSSPWTSFSSFVYLLQSEELRSRVIRRLAGEWAEKLGGRHAMALPLQVRQTRSLGTTVEISVRTKDPRYGEVYLQSLLEEHLPEWEALQKQASESAVQLLEKELARLEEKIRDAEDDLIEYQRLHDIARVDARGHTEAQYLAALVARRSQLSTELMLLEHAYPMLKDANVGVISQVEQLTRETGALQPFREVEEDVLETEPNTAAPQAERTVEALPQPSPGEPSLPGLPGWQELRVRLAQLEQRDRELATDLKPEHPQRRALAKEMEQVKAQLDTAAQIHLANIRDRYQALKVQLEAIEAAEYKWQAKNLYASQRRAELKRIAGVVQRFEQNYRAVYTRLHDLRVSEELKAEHFHILEPPRSSSKPLRPDPKKVLFVALALGLGSGLGLAVLLHVTDNKIQSIRDVEKVLGIPFLGGVPYWVHSGLERSVRPIVTEERATGAIEAYRALRTSLLTALRKVNEKIVIITSADSQEGKTLTALNLAIMIAEMDKKVLLIDMDMRRGRLHRSLGVERTPGFTDALVEKRSLRTVVQPTRVDNLWLIPCGNAVEHSAELLQASDLLGLLVEIQDDYDYVFIDTCPVLRVTDTVIIATQGIGVVVYVARVNHTPKPLIRYSLDMLGDARILGLIMNSIELHRISSLYYAYQYPNYAYYSNAYAYGYHYYHYDHAEGPRRPRSRSHWSIRRPLRRARQWLHRTLLPMD